MPRPRKPPPIPQDEWDGFLQVEEEPEEDLPPLPPLPAAEAARPAPDPVKKLGIPPQDPMKAAAWGFNAMMLLGHEALHDDSLTPTMRRREFMRCIQGAKGLMSDAMRVDVANKIDEHRRQLETKKRGKAIAKTEKRAPAPAGAKIIPIRRDG